MALPETVMTNEDLAAIVETSDEWIMARTGIRTRRIANDRESTATLGLKAAQQALDIADILPIELDLIIVATSTPESIFPSTASLIQDWLGAGSAGAFDLSAACSGFVYALDMAAQAIRSGSIKTAIVIGSETMSRVMDWQDAAPVSYSGMARGRWCYRHGTRSAACYRPCCDRMDRVMICWGFRRWVALIFRLARWLYKVANLIRCTWPAARCLNLRLV